MRAVFKTTTGLLERVREDLVRTHPFAAERVGFIGCRFAHLRPTGLLVLGIEYHVVADHEYIDDPRFGALVGESAFRRMLQHAYRHPVGVFHVHMHEHVGLPQFSGIDRSEQARFVPDFFKVRRDVPHGALVLSHDRLAGVLWLAPRSGPHSITEATRVGMPMTFMGRAR